MRLHLSESGPLVLSLIALCFPAGAGAAEPSPLERVQSSDLAVRKVGRVTVYYEPGDEELAAHLGKVGESAAAFFEESLATTFDFTVAALSPKNWFTEFPGQPYALPWCSMTGRLVIIPSSLKEGVLFEGSMAFRRRMLDYFLLHEYGHLFAKRYLRPASDRDFLPVPWLEELLANYFAYSYVATTDVKGSETFKRKWADTVRSFAPVELSLDWRFMNELSPTEVARTYDWYQNLINLRAARLFEQNGVALLPALKQRLTWEVSDQWTTPSVLAELDAVVPGFQYWADHLGETVSPL